jgi:hypothetical protein
MFKRFEEWCLLGCYGVWLLYEPTFRRKITTYSTKQRLIIYIPTVLIDMRTEIPLQEALFPVRREVHNRCELGRLKNHIALKM